uniref:Uncharacterized protein n=1 Tax=Ditylenchus dipsaci TaxID=166011 RepID=A0A915D9L8_9BILA
MSVEQLKKLLDKPSSSLVNEVIEHTKTYGTSGIELRCGHILRPETKQKFSGLLRDLQEGLHAQPVDHNKCHKTVGMKIYAWRTDLPTIYEIPTLNKLHHISMETFQVSTIKQVMLVEPLFDPNNQHLSIKK